MKKTLFSPAILLLLAAILIAGCGKPTVPDVTGKDVGYATGMLKGAGFTVKTVEHEEADVPPGQVLSQVPVADTRLSEGETVVINVAKPPEYTITGTFTLTSGTEGTTQDCHGHGGYDDIQPYLDVIVRSGDGEILAKGSLGTGNLQSGSNDCVFPIAVAGVPKADFYSIEVGHRGELTYSFAEMVAMSWTVAFTLG